MSKSRALTVQLSGQFLLDLPMGAMRELGDHDVQHESSLVCQLRACCQSFTYSVIFGPPFNANMLLSADRRLESQDGPAPSQAAAAPISKVNGTKSNTAMNAYQIWAMISNAPEEGRGWPALAWHVAGLASMYKGNALCRDSIAFPVSTNNRRSGTQPPNRLSHPSYP